MNKYLEKVAEMMSDENKQVAKTFATQAAVSLPVHAAGLAAGAAIGEKHLARPAAAIGRGLGHVAGKLDGFGKLGLKAGNYLRKGHGLTGAALGGVIGMQAAGGLADLATLKHGFHQHGKQE